MRIYPENWSDMSDHVIHFTKGSDDDDGYKRMTSILFSGSLIPERRFGIARKTAPDRTNQEAVCFSEIPPGEWGRLQNRRKTKYGIGFRKDILLRDGGGPIWYAWKDTQHWKALKELMDAASGDHNAPIWKITAMIDAPGDYGSQSYFFDWEREWRFNGSYKFHPEDVSFLLIPEKHHKAARNFFHTALHENLGPAYFCPFIDPSWCKERIQDSLRDSGIKK